MLLIVGIFAPFKVNTVVVDGEVVEIPLVLHFLFFI